MIDPDQDFLYNIIHYTLAELQEVAPLSYTTETCSFSIYDPLNCRSQSTLMEISKTVEKITSIDYLYPLTDPRSVYVDQVPQLDNGVFRFNPIAKIPTFSGELMDQIKQKINTLSASKKSRSLKYTLS